MSTHIVSDVSYIADTILMMKQGQFLLQEPMDTVTDSIRGKVWEFLADNRSSFGSSPAVGSSNIRIDGLFSSACAIPKRF